MKLDGFGIMVEDMAVMVEFYRRALGFEIDWDGKEPNVYLVKDGTVFMFYGRGSLEAMLHMKLGFAAGINGHFETAVSVPSFSDVDAAFANAVAMGGKPVLAPEDEPWGQRVSYVADPEGNLVEIASFGA